jgi:hypothetical protein
MEWEAEEMVEHGYGRIVLVHRAALEKLAEM